MTKQEFKVITRQNKAYNCYYPMYQLFAQLSKKGQVIEALNRDNVLTVTTRNGSYNVQLDGILIQLFSNLFNLVC